MCFLINSTAGVVLEKDRLYPLLPRGSICTDPEGHLLREEVGEDSICPLTAQVAQFLNHSQLQKATEGSRVPLVQVWHLRSGQSFWCLHENNNNPAWHVSFNLCYKANIINVSYICDHPPFDPGAYGGSERWSYWPKVEQLIHGSPVFQSLTHHALHLHALPGFQSCFYNSFYPKPQLGIYRPD